jgi:hypothetical protein
MATSASEAPQDSAKFTVGNTERFIAQDPASDAAVSCTGLQERTLPDGRLEVVANIKNRGPQDVTANISCTFMNDQGAPLGGGEAWSPLRVAGDSTEVVKFTAPGASAKRYEIRVRDAH